MMKSLIFIFLVCLLVQSGLTQSQEPATPSSGETPAVIDLTQLGKTYTISARMELPQVRIFDKRLSPDFKEVRAEKSFANELTPQAEQIQFEPITSGRVEPISNVEALLKKKRF